jgi:hypothetical protein
MALINQKTQLPSPLKRNLRGPKKKSPNTTKEEDYTPKIKIYNL